MSRKLTTFTLVLGVLILLALLFPFGAGEQGAPPPAEVSAPESGERVPIRRRVSPSPAEVSRPEKNEGEPVRAHGRVVDDVTSAPLADALVCAVDRVGVTRSVADLPHASTDADGRFALGVVTGSDADWRIVVRRSGYIEAVAAVGVGPVEIRLSPGQSVAGHVRDHTGRPIEGVEVAAAEPRVAGAMRLSGDFVVSETSPPNHGATTTDASGAFRVAGLRGGLVRVRASKRGWRTVGFPKPPPRRGSASIPVLESDSVSVVTGSEDLEIVMEPVWVGSLRVVDAASGAAIPAASVAQENVQLSARQKWVQVAAPDRDWFRGDEPWYTAKRAYYRRGGDGEDLQLVVSAPGYESLRQTLVPRGPDEPGYLEPVVVRLQPRAPVGHLLLAVSAGEHRLRDPLLVQVVVPGQAVVSDVVLEAADDSGRYPLTLPAGTYRLTVLGHAMNPTLDARPHDVEVVADRRSPVELELDAGIGVFRLREPSGAVVGAARIRVTSNERFARSWVLAPRDTSVARVPRWVEMLGAHAPGEFRVLLAPGSYRVSAKCLGYSDAALENVVIESGHETSVSLELEVSQ